RQERAACPRLHRFPHGRTERRRLERSGRRRPRRLPRLPQSTCYRSTHTMTSHTRALRKRTLAFLAALLALSALAVSTATIAQVSFERVLDPGAEPHNWLSYSRTLDNQRHSPLDQINTANVANLELAWVWQAKSLEKFEATPLVVDGVLYTVQAPNTVVALDAATGRL